MPDPSASSKVSSSTQAAIIQPMAMKTELTENSVEATPIADTSLAHQHNSPPAATDVKPLTIHSIKREVVAVSKKSSTEAAADNRRTSGCREDHSKKLCLEQNPPPGTARSELPGTSLKSCPASIVRIQEVAAQKDATREVDATRKADEALPSQHDHSIHVENRYQNGLRLVRPKEEPVAPVDPASEAVPGGQTSNVVEDELPMCKESTDIGGDQALHQKSKERDSSHEQLYASQVCCLQDQGQTADESLYSASGQVQSSQHLALYSEAETVRSSVTAPLTVFPGYSTNFLSSGSYDLSTESDIGFPSPMDIEKSQYGSSESSPFDIQDKSVISSGKLGPGGLQRNRSPPTPLVEPCYSSMRETWTSLAAKLPSSSVMDSNAERHSFQGHSAMVSSTSPSLMTQALQHNLYSPVDALTRDENLCFSSVPAQTDEGTMQLCLNSGFRESTTDFSSSASSLNMRQFLTNSGLGQPNMHGNLQDMPLEHLSGSLIAQRTLSQSSHFIEQQGFASNLPREQTLDYNSMDYNNVDLNNWRHGGNELVFLPGHDSTVQTSPFSGHLSTQIRECERTLMQYGSMRPSLLSQMSQIPQNSFQDSHEHTCAADGESSQFQGLSLSLSSLQPPTMPPCQYEPDNQALGIMSQAAADRKGKRIMECTDSTYIGFQTENRSNVQTDLAISAPRNLYDYGIQTEDRSDYLRVPPMVDSGPFTTSGSKAYNLLGSRFLKHAQNLLNEICHVNDDGETAHQKQRREERRHRRADCFPGPGSSSNSVSLPTSRDFLGADVARKAITSGLIVPPRPGGGSSSAPVDAHWSNAEMHAPLESDSREDLRKKKANLKDMIDEVDRLYKEYSGDFKEIIAQFNAKAGPGASDPYTAEGYEAMSRRFRALRDAVCSHYRAVRRALGEEDSAPKFSRREQVAPSARSGGEQQERSLQQLGSLSDHSWRPQRGLPEKAVSILRSWLFEHFLHPYPKDSDKVHLANQTGLTRSQVSNWFINARVRLWKPMVEEMYMDEVNPNRDGKSVEEPSGGENGLQQDAIEYASQQHFYSEMDVVNQQRMLDMCRPQELLHFNVGQAPVSQMLPRADYMDCGVSSHGEASKRPRHQDFFNSQQLGAPSASMLGTRVDSERPYDDQYFNQGRITGGYMGLRDQSYTQTQGCYDPSNPGDAGHYLGPPVYTAPDFVSGAGPGAAPSSSIGGVSLTLGLRHSDCASPLPGPVVTSQKGYSGQGSQEKMDSGGQLHGKGHFYQKNTPAELPFPYLSPGPDSLKRKGRLEAGDDHLPLHEYGAPSAHSSDMWKTLDFLNASCQN